MTNIDDFEDRMVNLNQKTRKLAGALQRRVARFLSKEGIIHPGDSGIVAVSGGADSLCLVHVLHSLQDSLGIKLAVAHLDHGLRGIESEADATFVSKIADELGLPSVIERRDVKSYKSKHKSSWEEAARRVRYEFLAETAKALDAKWVAVGHTVDDLAETVLMHMIRGSGIYGLRGIEPSRLWPYPTNSNDLKLIRPILELTRADTEGYCEAFGLQPRFDTSNLSDVHTRNRVRSQLLPELEKYNPKIKDALVRLSQASAHQVELLDWALEPIWGDVARDGMAIRIKANIMDLIPYALQVHLVRRAVTCLLGSPEGISEAHLDAIIKTIKGRAGTRANLPRGMTVTKQYGVAVLSLDAEADKFLPPPLEGEYEISVPGETRLPGWIVYAEIVPIAALKGGTNQNVQARVDSNEIWSDRWRAALDYEAVDDSLVLRRRRPGDRFYPHGMESRKKLQDFMVDAHIPRETRDRVPIFVARDKIVWVAGWRIDDRAKVTSDTKRALVIKMERDLAT